MARFIARFFTAKVKSMGDFVGILEQEGCRSVIVRVFQASKNTLATAMIGLAIDFQYGIKLSATTLAGRKVSFKRAYINRSGCGFADADDWRNIAIKIFLIAEKIVRELKEKFPEVKIDLMGPDGRPMDEKKYEKLHSDAKACGISI